MSRYVDLSELMDGKVVGKFVAWMAEVAVERHGGSAEDWRTAIEHSMHVPEGRTEISVYADGAVTASTLIGGDYLVHAEWPRYTLRLEARWDRHDDFLADDFDDGDFDGTDDPRWLRRRATILADCDGGDWAADVSQWWRAVLEPEDHGRDIQ